MKSFCGLMSLAFGVFVSLMALVSCNGDDDSSENANGGNGTKRIAKEIWEYGTHIEESVYSYDDKGRIIKITTTANGVVYDVITYTYGEMLINCTETQRDRQVAYIYKIENGLIVKRIKNGSTTYYSYDSERHLSSYTVKDGNSSQTTVISWSNGNIASVQKGIGEAVNWTSSNAPWVEGFYGRVYADPALQRSGYWGTLPKNMPSECDKDKLEYTVTEGMVTKIKELVYQKISSEYQTGITTIIWE